MRARPSRPAPQFITVSFTQPVRLSTVSAANLRVAGPNGATVTVGQPVGVDSATFPTSVRFPITITPAPGKLANGVYTDQFVPGSIVSQSGMALTGTVSDRFNLQQTQGRGSPAPRTSGGSSTSRSARP